MGGPFRGSPFELHGIIEKQYQLTIKVSKQLTNQPFKSHVERRSRSARDS